MPVLAFEEVFQLGVQHQLAGRGAKARERFTRALEMQPGDAYALHLLAKTEHEAHDHEEAIGHLDLVLELDDETARKVRAPSLNLKGEALRALGRHEEALACYQAALVLRPDHPATLNNMAVALRHLDRTEQAEEALRGALQLRPDLPEAHINLGNLLRDRGAHREACEAYEEAIRHSPRSLAAHNNLGNELRESGRLEEAMACYERALAIQPSAAQVLVNLFCVARAACDWRRADSAARRLAAATDEALRDGHRPAEPAHVYAMYGEDPQRAAVLDRAGRAVPAALSPAVPAAPAEPGAGLRLAYLVDSESTPDMVRLRHLVQAHHARGTVVEVFVLGGAPGPRWPSLDVPTHDLDRLDAEAAGQAVASCHADVVVELSRRPLACGAFLLDRRLVPLQLSWPTHRPLSDCAAVDATVSDEVILPREEAQAGPTRVLHLRVGHQALGHDRIAVPPAPGRKEAGLPDGAVVLACFAKAPHVSAALFEAWMDILAAVPDAVLWLGRTNPLVIAHLKSAATRRAIDPDRLCFARRAANKAQHLARLQCADIVLDCATQGSATATLDGLWAGVPAVTWLPALACHRAASSVLHGLGLPDLVARDLPSYAAIAADLARDGERRQVLRRYLQGLRLAGSLFAPGPVVGEFEGLVAGLAQGAARAAAACVDDRPN